MVFSSTIFLFVFLPICLLGYYLINPKFKNYFLLIMSLVFYAWGEPKFIFMMLLSIAVNYGFGLLVDKFREKKKIAKNCIFFMAAYNIAVFFVFKYLDFTIGNINSIFGETIVPSTGISLPIGISFFTFQAMSYVIDVYRKDGKVQKNPLNVALYITFFPQLIAGPIVRYQTVADQINSRKETIALFADGVKRFIYGLGKKVIISNTVAILADKCFNTTDYSELSVGMAWLGVIAYSLQIFFDFSGYSDMAIGLGKMFGFEFEENFNYPYISKTVSEFWRRWHISLGTWFRDYVYIPLGGSRVDTKARLVFNLFVVWLLTGVWHGANWTFILWGLLYFVLLTFEKLVNITKRIKNKIVIQLYRVFTLLCVMFGWVLFRSDSIGRAGSYIASMLGLNSNITANSDIYIYIYIASQFIVILLLGVILSTPLIKIISNRLETKSAFAFGSEVVSKVFCVCLLVVSIAFTVSNAYNPFIYFNF